MAPISLNKGKGEMAVPALVVMFFLGLKCRLVDGWVVVQAEELAGSPNAEMRNSGSGGCQAIAPFMEGAGGRREPGFPSCPAMPRAAIVLVVPRAKPCCSPKKGWTISNVIYQRDM